MNGWKNISKEQVKDMKQIYEVYVCSYKGDVVYVGEGRKGRHHHCNSGTSHVYELNQIHFTEGKDLLKVQVVQECTSKVEAEKFEMKLIKKFSPLYNQKNNGDRDSRFDKMKEGRDFIEKALEYARGFNYTKGQIKKFQDVMGEFIEHYGCREAVNGNVEIYSHQHFTKIGKPRLCSLARWVRTRQEEIEKSVSPPVVFYKFLRDEYSVDLTLCLSGSPRLRYNF